MTIIERLEGIAESLSSRGSAFAFASLGVITQTAHNGLISYELSSFEGGLRYVQAIIMAMFLSFALLFFTLTTDTKELKKENKKINILNIFFMFEVILNLYYWTKKNIIEVEVSDYYSMIIFIPLSIMIPYAIKEYAKVLGSKPVVLEVKNKETINTLENKDKLHTDLGYEKLKNKIKK